MTASLSVQGLASISATVLQLKLCHKGGAEVVRCTLQSLTARHFQRGQLLDHTHRHCVPQVQRPIRAVLPPPCDHFKGRFGSTVAAMRSVHALLGEAVERALEALPLLPGGRGVRRRLGPQGQRVLAGQLPQIKDEVLRLPLRAVHLCAK